MNFKGIYYSLTFRLALAYRADGGTHLLGLGGRMGVVPVLRRRMAGDLAGHQPFVQAERAKGSLHVRRDRQ